MRIIKLADTLGLTKLYPVALEKITGHPRKVYTQTNTVYRDEYQRRANDVYISLPYKVKNTILLKQLELSEQNLEDSQNQRQDCEQQLQQQLNRSEKQLLFVSLVITFIIFAINYSVKPRERLRKNGGNLYILVTNFQRN